MNKCDALILNRNSADELRQQQILSLEHEVKFQIRSVLRRASPGVYYEDLIGPAWIGAVEAVDRYDPGRGVRLSTFAQYRIRGELLEYLRSLSEPTIETTPPPHFEDLVCACVDVGTILTAVALTKRENACMRLQFLRGATQVQIGKRFGVHPSSISQSVTAAIGKIRRGLFTGKSVAQMKPCPTVAPLSELLSSRTDIK